jgi:hypothetical protein
MMGYVKKLLSELPRILLLPAFLLGTIAVVLLLIGAWQHDLHPTQKGPRDYPTVAAAEADLGFTVSLPSYFPSYLSWPPGAIKAPYYPYPAVETVYYSPSGAMVLSVLQVKQGEGNVPALQPLIKTVTQQTDLALDNIQGTLVTGTGTGGQTLNGAYWSSGGFYYEVVTSRAVRDLLTMVSSMP